MQELIETMGSADSIAPATISALSTGFGTQGSHLLFIFLVLYGVYLFVTKHIIPRDLERTNQLKEIFDSQISSLVSSSRDERENYRKTVEKFDSSIDKIMTEMDENNRVYRDSMISLQEKLTNVESSVIKISKSVNKLDKDLKAIKTDGGGSDDE